MCRDESQSTHHTVGLYHKCSLYKFSMREMACTLKVPSVSITKSVNAHELKVTCN